ncbi:MAG: hypothetical protein H5T61_13015 [Thermoflexales bacterium]|nr:hypothetical protein [Thermoflexales bacterium]
MSTKRILLTLLAAGAVLLAVGVGPRVTGSARALPPAQTGVTIPYSGRLSDEAGGPVADGAYDFAFALYAAESGGEPLWAETQEGVAVQGGAFAVLLGRAAPLPQAVLDGGARWLEVAVRGPGEAEFTDLSPRQELSAATPAAQAGAVAPANGLSCAHTHWGETWSGSGNGLVLYGNSNNYATLYARDQSPNGGFGMYGRSNSGIGVYGQSDSTSGYGVLGKATATSGNNFGVYGQSASTDGTGVYGYASATSGLNTGVYGKSDSGVGVHGRGGWVGVWGSTFEDGGAGVYGAAYGTNGYAGYFSGNVHVIGTLTKGGGGFKIDHPLDPANRYLNHSFVESPDMKNIYDGVVTLDANGEAVVQLPAWFSALNRDFRYQLTCIGGYAPVYIAEEIHDNQFKIAGGQPGLKVSWQVTGIRQDPWANAHRLPVEEDKSPEERGKYLHPEAHGLPDTMGIDYARIPQNEQGEAGR